MYKPRFKVVFSNERIITPSGLSMIGGMLGKSDFVKRCNRIPVDKKRSEPQIKNGDILLTYIGLLCQAKTSFEAVNEMKDDPEFYKDALASCVVSPPRKHCGSGWTILVPAFGSKFSVRISKCSALTM